MASISQSQRTVLYDSHKRLGARMVPFAGWEMPVQYESIKSEHHAVRSSCGVFDVSHMGEFVFNGQAAIDLLQYATTNDISRLDVGSCHYSFFLNKDRGTVDDAMVYRRGTVEYLVVVNAGNIAKDWAHVQSLSDYFPGCDVTDESVSTCLLAVQGPEALEIVGELSASDLATMPFHTLKHAEIAGNTVLLATSGYTGENGLEIFVDSTSASDVWQAILDTNRVTPCGLGARDTLRLEASLALYGHELDDSTSPIEAGLGFAVAKDGDYLGAEWVNRQRSEGVSKQLVMLEMVDKAIPRQGYEILNEDGAPIGTVTSGSLAPWIGKQIGMGYIDPTYAKISAEVGIQIRNRVAKAVQVRRPFYKRPKR